MATQLSQIVGAMVSALGTPTAVSAQIYRARMRELAAQHSNAVVVRVLSSTPARAAIQGGPMDWDSQIAVECYVRSATSTAPDLALDSLWAATYARLMANSLLGGLLQAELNCTQVAYDFDIDGQHTACLTSTWQAAHRSTNNSLE
jgi:hypothetical protein